MNSSKMIAIFFALFSLGSTNETFRILTSSAPDIAENRSTLIPIAIIITGLFYFLTFWFWRKYMK
jgi:hypothetical protein